MSTRNYSSTAQATTLSAGCTDTQTTITVSGTVGFPAVPFVLALDAGNPSQELVLVTAIAGTNLTVTRGFDSTAPSSHLAGAPVWHTHAAVDFRDSRAHEAATSGVHGVTGALLGASSPVIQRVVESGGTYAARPAGAAFVEWVGADDPSAQAGLGIQSGDTWLQA